MAVTAPPTNDAANRAVCAQLAKRAGVAKTQVSVRSGKHARDKVIRFEGINEPELRQKLHTPAAKLKT